MKKTEIKIIKVSWEYEIQTIVDGQISQRKSLYASSLKHAKELKALREKEIKQLQDLAWKKTSDRNLKAYNKKMGITC